MTAPVSDVNTRLSTTMFKLRLMTVLGLSGSARLHLALTVFGGLAILGTLAPLLIELIVDTLMTSDALAVMSAVYD